MANLRPYLTPGWNSTKPHTPPDLAFLETLQGAGMEVSAVIPDGKIHRCHLNGDKRGSVNGWYIFYSDNVPAGVYGTWKEGWQETWCARDIHTMAPIERQVYDQQMAKARKLREAERNAVNEEVAESAEADIARAHPATSNHPYLQTKHVRPHGIYQSGDYLLIPIRDINGQIQSIQRIGTAGDKLYAKGGKTKGGMHLIGTIRDLVYLAEGYSTGATVYEATGTATVIAFDCGNLMAVAKAIRVKHPGTKIVVCADNDQFTVNNPGLTKGKEVAEAVGGTMVFPVFQTLEGGPTDFNDLACREGMAAVIEQVTGSSGELQGMQFLSLAEIRAGLRGAQYLIKPFFEREATTVLFGESGTYKSFICIDIGLSVAYGIPYHGKRAHKGPVFYVCGEGSGGISRRIEAWMLRHPGLPATAPFYVSKVPGQLIEEGNAAGIAEAIRQQEPDISPALIIVDTLSTNIGNGDESSNTDIARLMNNVNIHLRDAFGSCVLIVHHVGHGDKDRERGAYALRGNADCRILVKPAGERRCSMHSLKVKDAPEFDPVMFSANIVTIPGIFDSEGETVTSIVLQQEEYMEQDTAVEGRQAAQALEVLRNMFAERRENIAARGGDPDDARVEDISWFEQLEKLKIIKSGASRQAKHKIKNSLKAQGKIDWTGRNLRIVE